MATRIQKHDLNTYTLSNLRCTRGNKQTLLCLNINHFRSVINIWFHHSPVGWKSDYGGYTTYLTSGEDEEVNMQFIGKYRHCSKDIKCENNFSTEFFSFAESMRTLLTFTPTLSLVYKLYSIIDLSNMLFLKFYGLAFSILVHCDSDVGTIA